MENINSKEVINHIFMLVNPLQFSQFTIDFIEDYSTGCAIESYIDLGAFHYRVENICLIMRNDCPDYHFFMALKALIDVLPKPKNVEEATPNT